jgi:hypothetical protein
MIIKKPTINTKNKSIRLESEISLEKDKENLRLYFEYPNVNIKQIIPTMDSFLVSLLLVAMKLGEDIKLDGNISPKLSYNLNTYQQYFKNFLNELKIINILPMGYEIKKPHPTKGSMCSFSGGVDSFYSFFSHLPKNQKNLFYQIRYIYFIRGFDIGNNNKSSFDICKNSYNKFAKNYDVKFIEAKTNFREVFENILSWEILHASVLAGSALNLNLTKSFIIPSSHKFDYSKSIWGSQQVTDFLLSTEYKEIIHHGADKSRADKINFISSYPETYNNLRVCWEKINGLNNCCECEKCLRTMSILKMINKLKHYKTFKNYSIEAIFKKLKTLHSSSGKAKNPYENVDLMIKEYYTKDINDFKNNRNKYN